MASVFVKETDAEGKETYKEIDLSTLDVREHPAFKEVLQEQIKTRQKLSELKKSIAPPPPEGSEEAPKPEAKSEVKPDVIPTPDAIAELVEKRLAEKAAAQAAKTSELETTVTNAMVKHGLPPSARDVLMNSRDIEAQATLLAKSGLSFANSPSGGEDRTDIETLFASIDKRMGLGKAR